MAKITFNSGIKRIQGTIDNWVYRKNGSGTAIASRPTRTAPPTAAQLAVRENFRAAAAYARAVQLDAVQRPLYEAAARAREMRLFAYAVAGFLTPPDVLAIDTSAYHGTVGQRIKVRASDAFEVIGVAVILRDGEGAVIQQGGAVLTNGVWEYTTTVGIAPREVVTIEATATDRPGHTGSLSITHTVA